MFGLHRVTIHNMPVYFVPPGYRRRKPRVRPKIGHYTQVIVRILEGDAKLPRKQRYTVKRTYDRLRDEPDFDSG